MKEIHYWVTDDGTTFEDYEAASTYEDDCRYRAIKDDIIALNTDGHMISSNDVDSTFFLGLKTEQAYGWWIDFCRREGCNSIGVCGIGSYAYDEISGSWVNLDDKIATMMKVKEILERG